MSITTRPGYQSHETVLASAARTATNNVAYINTSSKGAHVILDVTAIVDTPSITLDIQGRHEGTANWYSLLISAAVTGTGTTVYKLYPGATAAANLTADDILPHEFRIVMTHADTDSITYSVGMNLLST